MNKDRFKLKTVKQMNMGAGITAVGFALYLAASALLPTIVADIIAIVFGIVGVYIWSAIYDGRKKDKEAVSYSLLWGQSALTIMLVFFAIMGIRQWFGL